MGIVDTRLAHSAVTHLDALLLPLHWGPVASLEAAVVQGQLEPVNSDNSVKAFFEIFKSFVGHTFDIGWPFNKPKQPADDCRSNLQQLKTFGLGQIFQYRELSYQSRQPNGNRV